LLARVAAGDHLPADGKVTVLPPPDERSHGVLAFTAHHVIIADVTAEWVRERLPPGDLSAPLNRRSSPRSSTPPAARSTTSTPCS
jgi:hypothetical protein